MQSLRSAPNSLSQRATRYPQPAAPALAHASQVEKARPTHLAPVFISQPKSRLIPWPVRMNKILRTSLMAMCGLAILGYGFDVAASTEVSKLQEQARRLSEQNTELSAQLLRVISFQGIADCVSARKALRVPEQVMIVKEVLPPAMVQFEPRKHHLPVMSGY